MAPKIFPLEAPPSYEELNKDEKGQLQSSDSMDSQLPTYTEAMETLDVSSLMNKKA